MIEPEIFARALAAELQGVARYLGYGGVRVLLNNPDRAAYAAPGFYIHFDKQLIARVAGTGSPGLVAVHPFPVVKGKLGTGDAAVGAVCAALAARFPGARPYVAQPIDPQYGPWRCRMDGCSRPSHRLNGYCWFCDTFVTARRERLERTRERRVAKLAQAREAWLAARRDAGLPHDLADMRVGAELARISRVAWDRACRYWQANAAEDRLRHLSVIADIFRDEAERLRRHRVVA